MKSYLIILLISIVSHGFSQAQTEITHADSVTFIATVDKNMATKDGRPAGASLPDWARQE